MAVVDTVLGARDGGQVASLAAAVGMAPADAAAVVRAVVPELARAVERNTLSRGGLADVVGALGHGHHQAYLANADIFRHPAAREDGENILGHLVGTKDASRGIADRAARASGVDAAAIRRMLPMLAGMTMGALSQDVRLGFGDILGRMGLPIPGGGGMGGGGMGGIPDVSQLPGDSGGGRGLPAEDLPQAGGRQERGTGGGSGGWGEPEGGGRSQGGGTPFPFPLPRGGGDNPYGDLAEILRKGLGIPGGNGPVVTRAPQGSGPRSSEGSGFPFPLPQEGGVGGGQRGGAQIPFPMPGGGGVQLPGGAIGGGILWQIVRSILGGALGGFQSKGVMGWLFRAVLMRYGWQILRALLGRGLGR